MPSYLEIKDTKMKGKGVFAKESIKNGQIILSLTSDMALLPNSESSVLAIQVGDDLYLESRTPQVWHFWNHSCNPNTMFDSENFCMVALRDILIGEEITFHYCTTEFDLLSKNEAFSCFCGSENCIGVISGYKYLSIKSKNELKPYLGKYLLNRHQS